MRFKDFSLFNMFMTRPDPEYDIAFLLFDRNKQGACVCVHACVGLGRMHVA